MIKGFFITGTDTGIGKTVVAEGLIKAFIKRGVNVCPMKPVESGCSVKKGELFPHDAVTLLRASGVDEDLDTINPYRLRKPLAPSVAAEIEGIKIDKRRIISSYRLLSKKYDMVIVEGAGGLMVPVYKKYLFADLAEDLALSLIIVARPGLGTINHTLLTLEAARDRGLKIAGIVTNKAEKNRLTLAEKTNPAVIEELGGVPVLGIIPYQTGSNKKQTNKEFRKIAEKLYY